MAFVTLFSLSAFRRSLKPGVARVERKMEATRDHRRTPRCSRERGVAASVEKSEPARAWSIGVIVLVIRAPQPTSQAAYAAIEALGLGRFDVAPAVSSPGAGDRP